jgi:hypothetical protein
LVTDDVPDVLETIQDKFFIDFEESLRIISKIMPELRIQNIYFSDFPQVFSTCNDGVIVT